MTAVDLGRELTAESFFAGPGEMYARCRTLDWDATPLGPIAEWSPALRATVRLCLDSRFPMTVHGGREQVIIYNDAYSVVSGGIKHPWALGRRAREVRPDAWQEALPTYDGLFAGGPPVYFEDGRFVIERDGRSDETFWSFTLSSVRDDEGQIVGLYSIGMETTTRVRLERTLRAGEARQAYLVRLGDALRTLRDPLAVKSAASRLLGEHLRANRVMYVKVEGPRWTMSGNFESGVPPLPSTEYSTTTYGTRVAELLATGQPVAYSDIRTASSFTPAERELRLALNAVAAVAVPLVKDGQLLAVFVVHSRTPREWSEDEIALVEETAERTWAAAERARAEERLRTSEARFRAVADLVPDLLWESEANGFTLWYNARWYAYTGQPPEQAAGWGWTDSIHPDDRDRSIANYRRAAETSAAIVQQQHRIRRYDGTYRWFLVRAEAQRDDDGQVVRWFGAATDIHAQRMALDEAERLAAERAAERDVLRRQLAEAEEAERRRLARELHDQLGQHLTALTLGLVDARRLLDRGEPADARLAHLEELARLMTRDARCLALELRPPELDDVGLESALATYVDQWSARFSVNAEVSVTGVDAHRPLPGEVSTAIYRIVQEALTNVAKHAGATQVSVLVDQPGGEVRLIVEDNGRGFDVDTTRETARRERRLGLAGMEERVALGGGTFTIESSPRGGTAIYVRLPMGE